MTWHDDDADKMVIIDDDDDDDDDSSARGLKRHQGGFSQARQMHTVASSPVTKELKNSRLLTNEQRMMMI